MPIGYVAVVLRLYTDVRCFDYRVISTVNKVGMFTYIRRMKMEGIILQISRKLVNIYLCLHLKYIFVTGPVKMHNGVRVTPLLMQTFPSTSHTYDIPCSNNNPNCAIMYSFM